MFEAGTATATREFSMELDAVTPNPTHAAALTTTVHCRVVSLMVQESTVEGESCTVPATSAAHTEVTVARRSAAQATGPVQLASLFILEGAQGANG